MSGYGGSSATELGVNSASVATFVVFSKAFSIIVGGLTFIIVARLLGPSGYGIYTIAMGMAGFIGAFGSISIGEYLNKYIPELSLKGEKERIKDMLGVALLITLIIILAAVLVSSLFIKQILYYFFHSTVTDLVIYFSLIYLVFSTLFGLGENILISFADGKGSAIAQVVNISSQAAFSVSLVLLGYGALGAIIGAMLGLFFGFIYQILKITKHSGIRFNNVVGEAKRMLSFSIPLTASSIVDSLVHNFSVLYLSFFFLPDIVGLYGVASKIGTYIDLVTGSISAILIPMFSAVIANKVMKEALGKFYNYSIYFGLLFAIPIVIYIVVFSNALVISVFTSTYKGASLYMALIGFGILLGLFASYASSLAVSAGYIKKVFKYGIATSLTELLFLLILIPFLSVNGLIITIYYIGSIVADLLYLNFIRHVLKIKVQLNIAGIVIANIILALLLIPIIFIDIKATYQLLLGLIAIIFVYPILLGLFNAISRKELELLRKVLYKFPVIGIWLSAIIIYAELFQRDKNERKF